MCVCVCVCVCCVFRFVISVLIPNTTSTPKNIKKKNTYLITVHAVIQIHHQTQNEFVCVCVCVCLRAHAVLHEGRTQRAETIQ